MSELPLSRLLLEAFRALDSEIEDALEDRGLAELNPGQATALMLVERAGTRLTDLSDRAAVTKQAMMQVVDGLQDMGCVRRVPDPTDSRAKIVKLTAKGLRYRAEARKAVTGVDAGVKRQLGDRRHEALRSALEDLVGSGE